MLRLGHISFFGLGLVNLAFAFTATELGLGDGSLYVPSRLLVVGLVAMPVVCYLSAVAERFRHLFFVPVLSVIAGIGLFVVEILKR